MEDKNIELAKSIIEDYIAKYIDVLEYVELDTREKLADALLDYYDQEYTHEKGIKKIQNYIKIILMYGKIALSYKNNKTFDSRVAHWHIDVETDPNFSRMNKWYISMWCMIETDSSDFEFKAIPESNPNDIIVRLIINDMNAPYECDEKQDYTLYNIERDPAHVVKLINKFIRDYILMETI